MNHELGKHSARTKKPDRRVTGSGFVLPGLDMSTPESLRDIFGGLASVLGSVIAGTTTPPDLGFDEEGESFLGIFGTFEKRNEGIN